MFYWLNVAGSKAHILNANDGSIQSLIKKGKAPEECNTIGNIYIENKNINIYDRILSIIFTYNENGQLINRTKVEGEFEETINIDANSSVFYNFFGENLITIFENSDYSTGKKFLPNFKPEIASERYFHQNIALYKFGDTTCLFKPFSDYVYNITKTDVLPRYKFELGKHKVPQNLYENPTIKLIEFVNECKSSDYIWNINNFYESKNFIFFTFSFGARKYFAFYDKLKNKCFSSNKFYDDVATYIEENEIPYYFVPIGVDEDCIYFVAEAFHLIDNLANLKDNKPAIYNKITEKEADLSKIYTDLSLDSNPIIIKYTFKSNEER